MKNKPLNIDVLVHSEWTGETEQKLLDTFHEDIVKKGRILNDCKNEKGLDWFIDRIGKKVYRTDLKMCCDNCRENAQKGVVILDAEHAEVLYTYSRELGIKYEDL